MSYKVRAWSWCADYCKKKGLNPHFPENWDEALLEYRRQHNIFEVGDKVVKTNSKIKHAHIRVVISTSPSGGAVLDYQGFPYKYPCVRHATDAEIKAGHRLDLEVLHDHDIPPNTIVLER